MQFLYPSILWGLFVLAIPIIIHLFYFRRFKKVYFSNVRFLKEIKEETSTRNRLKNLLILLTRLLAFALLIFAFAQPFIPQGNKVIKGQKQVSLFIDNSYSMKALSSDIPLFDKAIQKAREIIEAYSSEDQFQILTHDFSIKQQRLLNKEDALNALNELKTSPIVKGLERIYQRQMQALDGNNRNLYILSDFQKSICDLSSTLDTTVKIYFIPFQSVQEKNVAIDSVWLESPVAVLNQNNKLLSKITNYSDQEVENISISLVQNGISKPLGQISLKANETKVDTASLSILKGGWQNINVKISDYPIQFDDRFYLSYFVSSQIKVLSLIESHPNQYLSAAFRGLSYFALDNKKIDQFQYAELKNYQLVILDELQNISSGLVSELSNYIINGGNVLVFPSLNSDRESYNALFKSLAADEMTQLKIEERRVSKINLEDFIFNDVYLRKKANLKLPISQSHYEFTHFSNRDRQELIWHRDGSPFMLKYKKGNGHLYVCVSPLQIEQNDLVLNAEVFIPMLFKMAISKAKSSVGSYTIGSSEAIEVTQIPELRQSTFKISGNTEFIPKQTILASRIFLEVDNQIKSEGHYSLSLEDKMIQQLSFNYNRKESDLSYYSVAELEQQFAGKGIDIIKNSINANFTQIIGEKEKGILLWKWCLIFALIFLAFESLILRFWK